MMFRHFINALLVVAASASLWSCAGEDLDSGKTAAGEGNITLTFSSARTGSRAADDTNNEDAINSLHVFLYPDGATDDTPATVSQAFTGLGAKQQTTVKMSVELDVMATLIGHDLTTSGTCRMVAVANLPAGVTLPENATVNQLRSQAVTASFGTQKVQTGFVMIGDTSEADRAGNAAVTFTPDGKGSGTGSGNAMLVRAAARISLALSVPDRIEIAEGSNAGTWTPVPYGMQVLLTNGVNRAAIDPSKVSISLTDEDYFNIRTSADGQYGFTDTGAAGGTYPYKMTVPFYTYPNSWEKSPTEPHRTFVTLIVPFQKNQETEYQTCYYRVPVVKDPDDGSNTYSLRRNTAYQVNIAINMLGSFSPQEPLEVEASYQTVDWAEVPTEVNIKDYRYLVVNQKKYVVNNQPSISIPFYTSHPVEISAISMSYKRFNMVNNSNGYGTGKVYDLTVDEGMNHRSGLNNTANNNDSIFSYTLEKDATDNNVLVINHPLVSWSPRRSNGSVVNESGYTSESDMQTAVKNINYYVPTTEIAYSPYTFTVTIKHSDQDDGSPWEETLTITQYPGMWIQADRNPYAGDGAIPNTGPGNAYVNGYQNSNYDRNSENLGGIGGIQTNSSNKNPNMYVITINTLGESQKNYVIDDPRTFYTQNQLAGNSTLATPTGNGTAAESSRQQYGSGYNKYYGWCHPATALYNAPGVTGNRTLTYYYPTNEQNQSKNVIAPKIRIASSYGVTRDLTREMGRRRCATYQEAGFPAGRWRLPTYSEVEFIAGLTATGKIPTLLSVGSYYLSAQGFITIDNDGKLTLHPNTTGGSSNRNSYTVRCVYDEWYWEKQTDYTITATTGYRLGDMPKNNPEEGH